MEESDHTNQEVAMKMLLTFIVLLCALLAFPESEASVSHFPDGVKIGPDGTGDERLPIFDADEWVTGGTTIGTLTAGEIKTIVIDDAATARQGASVLKARPLNVFHPSYHYDDLEVVNADVTAAGEITFRVRNRSGSTINFGGDQWVFSYINTVNPSLGELKKIHQKNGPPILARRKSAK